MTGAEPPVPRGTSTAPDEEKGEDDPNLPTSLLWCGTGQLFLLPRSAKRILMGSDPEEAQICIASRYVSAKHCRLTRTRPLWGTRPVWTVRDLGSKNGTFLLAKRMSSFPLSPGTMFLVGGRSTRLLALDDEMRKLYPELVDILGDESEYPVDQKHETPSPADVILAARNNDDIVIVAEPHCEQARLARTIHAISHLRDHELVPLGRNELPVDGEGRKALKLRAARSTVVLDLADDDRPLDQVTLAMLFKPRNQIRVIVLAAHEGTAFSALRGRYFPSQRIELRPLAERPEAIARLLDHILEEQGSPLRTLHLTPTNRDALQQASWPDNFTSLREAATWLSAIVRLGSAHHAALALAIAPTTFYRWLKQLGLREPLAPHFHV